MNSAVIIYGISNCDTVKKSRVWFDTQGIVYEFYDFKKRGVPEVELRRWAKALGWEALLNKKGTTWRKLDAALQATVTTEESAIALMMSHSSVIKRPVVAHSGKITVGFTPKLW